MINLVLNEEAEAMPAALYDLVVLCCEKTLEQEEFPYDCLVSFSITDNEQIQALNRETRGIDKATDVLSFPMLMVEDGVLIVEDTDFDQEDRVFLGDIVISLEKAREQAAAYGHTLEREVGFLTVHSMLHLLGYDHEQGRAEESIMFQKQEEILNALSITR